MLVALVLCFFAFVFLMYHGSLLLLHYHDIKPEFKDSLKPEPEPEARAATLNCDCKCPNNCNFMPIMAMHVQGPAHAHDHTFMSVG